MKTEELPQEGPIKDGVPTASPNQTPYQLYLVRHGETEWSSSSRLTGATEVQLTAGGQDWARELSPRLQAIPFTRVYSSPRLRARRTCYLAMRGKQGEVEPDLAEWNFGSYEGRREAEIREKRADWDIFRDGCPHGESPEQASERADRLLARLGELGGIIALFTHDQFSAVLAARWAQKPVSEAESLIANPGSVSVLSVDPHHPGLPVFEL